MAKMKGSSRVAWMGDEEIKMLQNLTEAVDLPQTQVLSRIISAGLRCLSENGNAMPLPLKFQLTANRLNEVTRDEQKDNDRKALEILRSGQGKRPATSHRKP